MTIGENIRKYRKQRNLSQGGLAREAGVSQAVISDLERGENQGSKFLPQIARALDVPLFHLDESLAEERTEVIQIADWQQTEEFRLATGTTQSNHNSLDSRLAKAPNSLPFAEVSGHDLPVKGRTPSGKDGRFIMSGNTIELVKRPPKLETVPSAYALYIDGSSMEPRYFSGEIIHVHPEKPPKQGKDVVIGLREFDGTVGATYVRRYLRETETHIIVGRYNTPDETEFRKDNVVFMHAIVGTDTD